MVTKMDIHRPKLPHSWREFATEIGIITLGILIALGLEAIVTSFHNREVVEKSRAQLLNELSINRAHLQEVVEAAKIDQKSLRSYIAYGQARLRHSAHLVPNDPLPGSFTTLSTAGWESTVATNALVHMPFDEANAVATAYASSRAFNSLEERIEEHWFELSSIGDDPSSLSDAETRKALGQLRVAYTYQTAIALAGADLQRKYDEAIAALRKG